MDMKTGILFKLKDGAIFGNDKGNVGYMSEDLCDSDICELTVIKAHPHTHEFYLPSGEVIELKKFVFPASDGMYKFWCGYGKVSETWVVKGDVEKLQEIKAPPTSDHTE